MTKLYHSTEYIKITYIYIDMMKIAIIGYIYFIYISSKSLNFLILKFRDLWCSISYLYKLALSIILHHQVHTPRELPLLVQFVQLVVNVPTPTQLQ